jgi:type I restriction enzyme S subunit
MQDFSDRLLVPPNPFARYLISQSQMKLTANQAVADPLFLYYQFRSPEQQDYVRRNTIQTGVPHTNLGILRETPIILPPLFEQQAIAHILGTLDDKIELNRRMNETLEATARAIFKSWFVDFDPVHAKLALSNDEGAAGEQPTGLAPQIADLFLDGFEESELGEIPRGWKVEPIGDLVKAVGGGTPSTKNPTCWDEGIHCFATPKDLSGLPSPMLLDTERRVTDAGLAKISSGLLPVGTVLLSSRAPVGYLAIAEIPVCVNQGFIAMICDGRVSNYYALNWTLANMPEIKRNAGGTTFAEISKRNFRPILALVPSPEVLTAFDTVVEPLYTKIRLNLEESRTLAALRDTLLPRLISGELRVPDAEKLVEAAL